MQIVYHKKFKKRFQQLPQKIQEQFDARLALFMQNKFDPRLNNHSVEQAYPDCRSINVTGDYRAIFFEREDRVIFITIGTHSRLY